MTIGTIIALCGLGLTIITQLITIGIFLGRIDSLKELFKFRLDALEKKQDKYNHLQERMACVEESSKSAHIRISEVRDAISNKQNI